MHENQTSPAGHVVIVTFQVAADQMERFMRLLCANAAESLAVEPGCLQFDVCRDLRSDDGVLLYEVYASRQDFEAHLDTPHFRAFDAAVQGLVRSKHVQALTRVFPAGRQTK